LRIAANCTNDYRHLPWAAGGDVTSITLPTSASLLSLHSRCDGHQKFWLLVRRLKGKVAD
ncbi:MAG: hypothetical protein U5L01_07405, partial [Rheinheimera sp.]|nr:hypothetical protein [Rheinheimera sp.]